MAGAKQGTLPTIFSERLKPSYAGGILTTNFSPDYQFSRIPNGFIQHAPPFMGFKIYGLTMLTVIAGGIFWLRIVTPLFFEPRCHVSHKNAEWLQACWDRTDPVTIYRNLVLGSPWTNNSLPDWRPRSFRGLAPEERFPESKGSFPIWYRQW